MKKSLVVQAFRPAVSGGSVRSALHRERFLLRFLFLQRGRPATPAGHSFRSIATGPQNERDGELVFVERVAQVGKEIEEDPGFVD